MILIGISFRVGEKQNGFDAVWKSNQRSTCFCLDMLLHFVVGSGFGFYMFRFILFPKHFFKKIIVNYDIKKILINELHHVTY